MGWIAGAARGRLIAVDHAMMRKTLDSMLAGAAAQGASRTRFVWRDPRIDALIDSYVEWREECETVKATYERWGESERSQCGLAYAAYRAALDREEKAAAFHRLAATRLEGAARNQRQS